MRQRSPDAIRRIEDSYLKVPPVEDGNTPAANPNQGFIFTSESIDDYYYDTEYSSPVLSFSSRRNATGAGFVYEIVVEYTATEGASATNPGLYGSNLFTKGDFFTITSLNDNHDYIRGLIVDILDVEVSGPIGDIYTYEYNLLCNINEGDPLLLEVGDSFVWKRRIFTDRTNEVFNLPPVSLLSTVKPDGVYFRWTDPTERALKFNLRVRSADISDGGGITYFFCPGISAVGNGKAALQLFIGSTGSYNQTISCAKITDPGDFYSVAPTIYVVGTGTGASISTQLDNSGSLKIDSFRVYSTDHTSEEIYLYTQNPEVSPATGAYVQGIGSDVFLSSSTSLGNGRFTITLNSASGDPFTFNSSFGENLVDQTLQVHNGALMTGVGSNYRRAAYTKFKEYSSEDRFYSAKGASGIALGSYYWSVCGVLQENNKTYTEWSVEYPLTVT